MVELVVQENVDFLIRKANVYFEDNEASRQIAILRIDIYRAECEHDSSVKKQAFESLLQSLERIDPHFVSSIIKGGQNPPQYFVDQYLAKESDDDPLTDDTIGQSSVIIDATANGVFCRCVMVNDTLVVDTIPVAQGSETSSKYENAYTLCMYKGLPIDAAHFWTPTGKSENCMFLNYALRSTECIAALSGNVTSCGDDEV